MNRVRTENEFPTVRDVQEQFAKLVEKGLGDLPVQIVIVPDSTMQAMAKVLCPDEPHEKPALMMVIGDEDSSHGRVGVSVITADRLGASENAMPSRSHN